ncbi:tyrosine-type recombinase/integrase [Rhodococcus sp. NPDC059968]|uniref:tyrosine-type recombinase/integrase n=1 Tax=Rhodococcus sp. NPDC059968 TaxID=3347017 RepID=UPI00366F72AF
MSAKGSGNTRAGLTHLSPDRPGRAGRDRLEILTALIDGPSFDPTFRPDVIEIPPQHPIYRWECVVDRCERPRTGGSDLCSEHLRGWARDRERGVGKAAFLVAAEPLQRHVRAEELVCRICPQRPAAHSELQLCRRHIFRWGHHQKTTGPGADFTAWLTAQPPLPGHGTCLVAVCVDLADSPLGLCPWHGRKYQRDGQPGGAVLPPWSWHRYEQFGRPIPIDYTDEATFRRWCAATAATPWPGKVNLHGLRPLVRAEIKWGLFIHTQRARPTRWDLRCLRSLAVTCRARDVDSLIDLELGTGSAEAFTGAIVKQILHELRLIYFTPAQAKEAGYLETDYFGVRFDGRASHVDLTGIAQRWLRDLVWDYFADMLQSPRCPRSGTVLDGMRRAALELGTFLELDAPESGHDPRLLDGEHMRRFVADQRRRERDGLPSLAMKRTGRTASTVTTTTRSVVFNSLRKLLRTALDNGAADRIGLAREFIVVVPTAGAATGRTARRPFPDEVARALADEQNLQRLAAVHDPLDKGLRDIWETTVTTGRRIGEVLQVRWDCLGRYGGLPMFWHDQTKVGNYDAAIRIPESLHDILAERQRKTLDRFTDHHGRRPTDAERAGLALFPTATRNPDGTISLTYQWFHSNFSAWVDSLELGRWVPHQARHTLATNLLRAGASLTHIRAYLGQVSDRMAEHYVHLSHSDLEEVLAHVWVAGPGAISPGEFLAGDATPMTREQAQALAIDLSRSSTPAEGGFCTFQPVVDGGTCPWNLNCHSCDKFVLSGADLLYWRRKREQWRQLAEGAPDDVTADYLHQHFEPTARAIDGLEKALAGLGLLDQALALDLRKPQDYFHRVWSIAFRAADLTEAPHTENNQRDGETE